MQIFVIQTFMFILYCVQMVLVKKRKRKKKNKYTFEMYLQLVFLLVFSPISDLLFLSNLCL